MTEKYYTSDYKRIQEAKMTIEQLYSKKPKEGQLFAKDAKEEFFIGAWKVDSEGNRGILIARSRALTLKDLRNMKETVEWYIEKAEKRIKEGETHE